MKFFALPHLLITLTFFQLFSSFGQNETVTIDGESYMVYPIREQLDIPSQYWSVVKDEAYFEDPNNYFDVFGESRYFSRKAFDTASNFERGLLYEDLERYWDFNRKPGVGYGHRFRKVVRKNPGSIIIPNYSKDTDILPAFAAIPDGRYVQLFNDFCYVNSDGMCESKPRVSAIFSIKDNMLDGHAVWLTLDGDTLKEGSFKNGLRVGKWTYKDVFIPSYYTRWRIKPLKKTGQLGLDTTYYEMNYDQGVLNGPYKYINSTDSIVITGNYTDGVESGNWQTKFNGALVYNVTFADKDNPVRSHKPIIRTRTMLPDVHHKTNLYSYTYGRYEFPIDLYEIDFGIDKELELEEEEFQSHELEYRYYESYNANIPARILRRSLGSFIGEDRFSYNLYDFITDPNTEKVETRGWFIDSLGAKILYDGNYEIYYPNGQLYLRYIFENGELVDEGTVYWDNGQPYDVIEFNADSNYYYRNTYDYDGKPMRTAIYDSLGDFLRYDVEQKEIPTIQIDGIEAELVETSNSYIYNPLDGVLEGNYVYKNFDAFDSIAPDEPVTIYREYNGYDKKSIMSERTFDPRTMTYTLYEKSYTGKEFLRVERTFGEDFKNWTGSTTWKYGRFTFVNKMSATLDTEEKDTLPMRNVMYPSERYDVTSDIEIFRDGELYTGPVKLKPYSRKFKFNGNKLVLKESYNEGTYKLTKKLRAYLEEGKYADNDDLGIVSGPLDCSSIEESISSYLFDAANSDFFYYKNSSSRQFSFGAYSSQRQASKIKGQMVEGRPQGHWTGKRSLKLMNDINFDRGEPIGTYKQYAIQNGTSRYIRRISMDSLPKHRVHFLDITMEYVNGMAHGHYTDRNWHGFIEEEGNYVDDLREGKFYSRNKYAYSISEFHNGMLDGYVQTYLTLPYMDTLLLYDINFQHGLLNGESNAYHTNGKLAKRGFFLDGEPIDDYEAFDTLGFRYHYVKFKYGFPVEEKIWEENELSLRYMFNWEDSVEFDPSDITSTMSLEALMADLGYSGASLNSPFYGRQRLINKAGLDYHMTKFYPNDTIARIGRIDDGKKIGNWKFYDYYGEYLYEVDYFDSIIHLNDSVRFKSKGILTDYNSKGDTLFKAYIIEKMEKYDCAHTDHYEIRQFYTFWEADDSVGRMNGYVYNYYDNGVIQSEGQMKDGLPTGLWKYYDPFGKLNLMGSFHQGKRHGRWLSGDLEKKKYLGEICLNPNLPDLEAEKEYRENLIDVTIITYYLGQAKNKQFYDLDLNRYSNLIDE